MFSSVQISLMFYIFSVMSGHAAGINLEDELRVTYDQKLAIDRLRQRVIPFVTENYMKEDLNLLRWLRVTNFNLDRAENRIREDVKWRQQNKVSTILLEDFSDIESEYPFGYTVDKHGQPVFVAYAGDWDIRGAVLTGRTPRVTRYLIQRLEKGIRHLRRFQESGHNVTRINLIDDLGGFNIQKHACPACLYRILESFLIIDTHYPGIVDRAILVNTPPSMAIITELIRGGANPETWRSVKVYGRDKSVWQRALLEFIDRDKLPERFGGNMNVMYGNLF